MTLKSIGFPHVPNTNNEQILLLSFNFNLGTFDFKHSSTQTGIQTAIGRWHSCLFEESLPKIVVDNMAFQLL